MKGELLVVSKVAHESKYMTQETSTLHPSGVGQYKKEAIRQSFSSSYLGSVRRDPVVQVGGT